jgi:hypothetical protein
MPDGDDSLLTPFDIFVSGGGADADGGDQMLLSSSTGALDHTPTIAWGDSGAYYLDEDAVKFIAAEYTDSDGKNTRLNNKNSLWDALEALDIEDIPIRRHFKIPTHVVATRSWDASLSNAVLFALLSREEQQSELRRFRSACERDKQNCRDLVKRYIVFNECIGIKCWTSHSTLEAQCRQSMIVQNN